MSHRFLVVPLALALCAASTSAQSIIRTLTTTTLGNRFGSSLARMGDLNGDGFADLVAGAPNPNGHGAVFAASGQYLALGTGPQFLWVYTGVGPQPGGQFGTALANVGDIDGDGASDVAVGMPWDWDSIVGWVGSVRILSGATSAQITAFNILEREFGSSLAAIGDYDGDGSTDLIVGSPGSDLGGSAAGAVYLLSPRKAHLGQNWYLGSIAGAQAGERFGASVGGADLDNDGKFELIVGSPYYDFLFANDLGRVQVFRGSNLTLLRSVQGGSGSSFGWSLSADGDVNGDGVEDLLVGAPYDSIGATDAGAAILFSGARLLSGATPYDLARFESTTSSAHFGTSVDITEDLNGDGRRDVLVGAPDWESAFLGQENGAIYVYSGETLERLGWRSGAADDHLGACVLGVGDYDGDGRADLAAGGAFSDVGVPDGGRLDVLSLFPVMPVIYCTSKVNSLGCTPFVSSSGSPSASSPSSFLIKASNVLNNKNGLLFYGFDASAAPFQGGTLCVAPPTKRTPVQSTGGNPPPNDCSGSLSYDFNALIQSGSNPSLVVGQEVFAQYWSRDPSAASTTSLTNALRFPVNP